MKAFLASSYSLGIIPTLSKFLKVCPPLCNDTLKFVAPMAVKRDDVYMGLDIDCADLDIDIDDIFPTVAVSVDGINGNDSAATMDLDLHGSASTSVADQLLLDQEDIFTTPGNVQIPESLGTFGEASYFESLRAPAIDRYSKTVSSPPSKIRRRASHHSRSVSNPETRRKEKVRSKMILHRKALGGSSQLSSLSKRGSYKCGRCGVPKKGHVCPYAMGKEVPHADAAIQCSFDSAMTVAAYKLAYACEVAKLNASKSTFQRESGVLLKGDRKERAPSNRVDVSMNALDNLEMDPSDAFSAR